MKWKVYFEGDFWGHYGRDHAGKEIPVRKEFQWGDRRWLIPSIYSCARGLVVDFCVRIPMETMENFAKKWNLSEENADYRNFSQEEEILMDADNPLSIDFHSEVTVNGKILQPSRSCNVCWNPWRPEGSAQEARDMEGQELEAQYAVEYYGLDPADAWNICRVFYNWTSGRRPDMKSLDVMLSEDPSAVPGPHFRVAGAGDRFRFICPINGAEHTLLVDEYERQEMPKEHLESIPAFRNMEFPTHYTVMSYRITPELPDEAFNVYDCVESDRPRQKKENPFEPEATGSAAVGIIGGADGPTAVFMGGSSCGKHRAACSALHFEPVDEVEWRLLFYEKRREDLTVSVEMD